MFDLYERDHNMLQKLHRKLDDVAAVLKPHGGPPAERDDDDGPESSKQEQLEEAPPDEGQSCDGTGTVLETQFRLRC